MRKFSFLIFSAISLFLLSCNAVPDIDDATMLDGDQIFDASIYTPTDYLVSAYLPFPTVAQKDTPVIICAHGYSASTFEWDELRTYANAKKTFYVSQVLLGGHGTTYADFKAASWHNWQQSIKEEYTKLYNLGFKNIYLAGSSTGAPLLVDMICSGYFEGLRKPKGFFLIDPIVVSSNKTLTMVGLLGPILGYMSIDLDPGEAGKWYTYRPQESLKQLMALINKTRKDLQQGIVLPQGAELKIYKSKLDGTADPVSAVLLYRGLKKYDGTNVDVEMISSDLHVFTRLHGRKAYTNTDMLLQQKAFEDIESRMLD